MAFIEKWVHSAFNLIIFLNELKKLRGSNCRSYLMTMEERLIVYQKRSCKSKQSILLFSLNFAVIPKILLHLNFLNILIVNTTIGRVLLEEKN